MNNSHKLPFETKQALEMIRASKYMQGINRVTLEHAKFLNAIESNNTQEAIQIVDRMVKLILKEGN